MHVLHTGIEVRVINSYLHSVGDSPTASVAFSDSPTASAWVQAAKCTIQLVCTSIPKRRITRMFWINCVYIDPNTDAIYTKSYIIQRRYIESYIIGGQSYIIQRRYGNCISLDGNAISLDGKVISLDGKVISLGDEVISFEDIKSYIIGWQIYITQGRYIRRYIIGCQTFHNNNTDFDPTMTYYMHVLHK